MPLRTLRLWLDSKDGAEVRREVQRRLEALQAASHGRWRVVGTKLRPRNMDRVNAPAEFLAVSHATEAADVVHLVKKNRVLNAEADAYVILTQHGDMKTDKRAVVDGTAWQLGDFVIRLGDLQLEGKVLGCVLDVECTACTLAMALASPMLEEFLQHLLRSVDTKRLPPHALPPFMPDKWEDMPSSLTLVHTTCLYTEVFKAAGIVTQSRPAVGF